MPAERLIAYCLVAGEAITDVRRYTLLDTGAGGHRQAAGVANMELAAGVLGLAALGGLTLAGIRLRGTPRPPTWIALGHGGVVAIGLGLLIYAAFSVGIPGLAQLALGVLILAALGGATIFAGFHLRNLALPIPLVIGHGLIALTGWVLLLVSLVQSR
jgi:hypothetical protein